MGGMATTQVNIINHFVKKYNYTSYLEIGSGPHGTFPYINITYKEGIDPREKNTENDKQKTIKIDSDKYFKNLERNFDIIHIDGNHKKDQVMKDILNSLEHLNENGTIICHDVHPTDEGGFRPHRNGTVWESFAELRHTREDLFMFVIRDSCCGVIRRGKQKLWKEKIESTWKYYNDNKEKMLNVIDYDYTAR
jgi:hypothetical protein